MTSIYQLENKFGTADDWGHDEIMYLLHELRSAHKRDHKGRVRDFGLVWEALAIAIIAKEDARTFGGMAEIVSKISRVAYTSSLIADEEKFDPELCKRLNIADIICYRHLPINQVYEIAQGYIGDAWPAGRRRKPVPAAA